MSKASSNKQTDDGQTQLDDMSLKADSQPAQQYDASLKDLVEQQAAAILPLLLPGAVYKGTLNVEMIRPAVRADKVFLIDYKGTKHILHLEFETGADNHMAARMLAYNAILYHDQHRPVISILVYPFKTTMARTPLVIENEDGLLIHFKFVVLPLFTLDAEQYVRAHATCIYPLLPAMEGVTHELMQQVMNELAELYREDETTLAQQYAWIKLLLERSGTVPLEEKSKIMEVLNMFDHLWNESPMVKKMKEESEARGVAIGEARGKAEGALQVSREILINLVKARFPSLADLAQQKAAQMSNVGAIEHLIELIGTASDEHMACWLLSPTVA
ncbi:MAG: hypothetical protein E6J34_01290 [Chloroflexi bacterium]|nr:MAG: hypothetical protein E6J34_01290 [Chloroflexota bacterium]